MSRTTRPASPVRGVTISSVGLVAGLSAADTVVRAAAVAARHPRSPQYRMISLPIWSCRGGDLYHGALAPPRGVSAFAGQRLERVDQLQRLTRRQLVGTDLGERLLQGRGL